MIPKYKILSEKKLYTSGIILEQEIKQGIYEKTLCQIQKPVFKEMVTLYKKAKEAEAKSTISRLKKLEKSRKDPNDGTNKEFKKAQILWDRFIKKYGDFYNDFVRWSKPEPGVLSNYTREGNYGIVSNHAVSIRLLTEFLLIIKEYEEGTGKSVRKIFVREDEKKKAALEALSSWEKLKSRKQSTKINKYSYLLKYMQTKYPKLLRLNLNNKDEEKRARRIGSNFDNETIKRYAEEKIRQWALKAKQGYIRP